MVRELEPCGTLAAFRRHERAGEDACNACLAARDEHQSRMYRQRKERAAAKAELHAEEELDG